VQEFREYTSLKKDSDAQAARHRTRGELAVTHAEEEQARREALPELVRSRVEKQTEQVLSSPFALLPHIASLL
jgi:hypothetical protein